MCNSSDSGGADGAVETLYQDYCDLVSDLASTSPSGLTALNRTYHKVILIAAASNLEARVKSYVRNTFASYGRDELSDFVSRAVLARGYHALFDWKNESAKGFFSHYGSECSARFKEALRTDEAFNSEHSAFMQLGNLRNQLVHQDYATFPLLKTPDELIALYRLAARFPDRFESLIFVETVSTIA